MADFYRVVKYVNEFLLDIDGNNELCQIGDVNCVNSVIAYSKTLSGAKEFLEGYFDEAIALSALLDDKLVCKGEYPKRRLTYRTFSKDGPIRHLITLVIQKRSTILGDCL